VDGAIHLKGDDVFAVEAMLRFMYTSDYDASGSAGNSASPMVFNAKVYSIADKYDVPSLKSQAREKFKKTVETCWNMDDFPYAIAEAYNSTTSIDRGLRKVVVDIACKHINELLMKQGFRDILEDIIGFASDITQYLARSLKNNEKRSQTKYECPSCEKQWETTLLAGGTYYCMYCSNKSSNWSSYIVK
jgi:speckle-type POZ protein